jgi:hypothetical protein
VIKPSNDTDRSDRGDAVRAAAQRGAARGQARRAAWLASQEQQAAEPYVPEETYWEHEMIDPAPGEEVES